MLPETMFRKSLQAPGMYPGVCSGNGKQIRGKRDAPIQQVSGAAATAKKINE